MHRIAQTHELKSGTQIPRLPPPHRALIAKRVTLFKVARLAVCPHAVLPDLRDGEAVFQLQRIDLKRRLGVLVEKGKQSNGSKEGCREDDKASASALLLLRMDG